MNSELGPWLREEMAKLHTKLDRLDDRADRIDVTLTKQAGDIEYHIRRTDALETRVEQVATELKPVQAHVSMLHGAGRFIALVATVAGIVAAVTTLL